TTRAAQRAGRQHPQHRARGGVLRSGTRRESDATSRARRCAPRVRQTGKATRGRRDAWLGRREALNMARTPLELHIEELVLVGFPAGDRHRIQDAVHAELMNLLARGALTLPRPTESLAIDASAPQTARVSARPTAAQVGAGVARSIVDG